MSTTSHAVESIAGRELRTPALGALLLLLVLAYIVAFDQGQLASLATERLLDSGGVLHEFFHDARHLLGVPCH
jgi:Probable cobalt transporter subunit (CbtB)